jgi:cell division topological specificity factor
MPRLRSELLEVIKKYVQVNDEAVKVNFEKDKDGIQEVLDIQIALPDKS